MGGGGIYISEGTEAGGKATEIFDCIFINCHRSSVCSNICASYDFVKKRCQFLDHIQYNKYGNEALIYPKFSNDQTINNCIFERNFQADLLVSKDSTSSSLSLIQCTFNNNEVKNKNNSYKGIIDFSDFKTASITIENCNFTSNKGVFLGTTEENCKSQVLNCQFKNNEGSIGCAIYAICKQQKSEYKMAIDGCTFQSNKGTGSTSVRGCVSIDTSYVEFLKCNLFINNEVSQTKRNTDEELLLGGSLFINQLQPAPYSFYHGSAIGIYAGDYKGQTDLSRQLIYYQ